MNSRQRKTLKRLFDRPIRSDIAWTEVESLFRALGAKIQEGEGSRIRIKLNDVRAVFHKPHPSPNIKKYVVDNICDFLEEAEINYE